jgi:hypothetical protein
VSETVRAVPDLTPEAKQRIESILDRASADIRFREELLRDPQAALASSDLTSEEVRILSSLKRVALEEWGIDVRRFRAFLRDNGFKIEVL